MMMKTYVISAPVYFGMGDVDFPVEVQGVVCSKNDNGQDVIGVSTAELIRVGCAASAFVPDADNITDNQLEFEWYFILGDEIIEK